MTDKHIPASKLLALKDYWDERMGCMTVRSDDLRALIDAEPESVEPVAVIALKNSELNNRVCVLEDLLSSAYAIANRNGSDTHWPRFASKLHINGISPITAKTFKVLPSDVDYSKAPPADNLIAELQATIDRLTEDNILHLNKLIDITEQRDRLLEALKDRISNYSMTAADASIRETSLRALIAEIEANNE